MNIPSHNFSDETQPFGWQKYSPCLHSNEQCVSSELSPQLFIPKK